LAWPEIGRVGLWSVIAWFATALNPNGFALWGLPFYTVQVSINGILEWASPNFHRPDMHFMLWLIFLLLLSLGSARSPLALADRLKFIGFAYMAFVSQRSLGPFVVIAVPVVVESISAAWRDQWQPVWARLRPAPIQTRKELPPAVRVVLNSTIILLITSLSLVRLMQVTAPDTVLQNEPAGAVAWIGEQQPRGRIFNSYNWGGYLLWALPEYPVFIDGRADLYGSEIIQQWWEIVNGTERGFALLDRWDINLVVLEPEWQIIDELPSRGWRLLFSDEKSVVYGR
jgi:hypothetical protein